MKMAAQGLFLLVIVSAILATSQARTIVVGGSENWRYGFNYTGWALQNGPFYINDTLVFKYEPPSDSVSAHNVYLLPNLWSYIRCDFTKAKLLANTMQGGGEGFSVVLNQWRPYYFACSEGNGDHCDVDGGQMKFFAVPWPRRRY